MPPKTNLRAYFKQKAAGYKRPVAKRQVPNPDMIISTTENVNRAEIEMAIDEVEKSTVWKNNYSNILKHS